MSMGSYFHTQLKFPIINFCKPYLLDSVLHLIFRKRCNFVQLHIYQGDACSQRYYYQICLIVMTTFTAQSKDKNRYQGIGP